MCFKSFFETTPSLRTFDPDHLPIWTKIATVGLFPDPLLTLQKQQ